MTFFQALLILATFLCSLVAGLLFAFAVVIMPGLGSVDDAGFIRAFQVIDRVIQKNQPLFMLLWVGSVLSVVAAAVLGLWSLGGTDRLLLMVAAFVYLFGARHPPWPIPTRPCADRLQKLEIADTMSEAMRSRARHDFEPRWNRWNAIRTACASLTAVLLLVLLFRA